MTIDEAIKLIHTRSGGGQVTVFPSQMGFAAMAPLKHDIVDGTTGYATRTGATAEDAVVNLARAFA